jgi:hypothetical protein
MQRVIMMAVIAAMLHGAAQAQLRATATTKDLSVSGATPNGKVAVCRIANERLPGGETMLSQHGVVRADQKGSATMPAEQAASHAVWLAVDLVTGDYVISTPAGYKARELAPPVISHPGVSTFTWSRPTMEVFVVGRLAAGVWHGAASDGTDADDDHRADGNVTFNLGRLEERLGEVPKPLVLTPGDVVFVADPGWMVYSVVVVPKGANGAN